MRDLCGGASICEHNRLSSQRKQCVGASICEITEMYKEMAVQMIQILSNSSSAGTSLDSPAWNVRPEAGS